MKTLLAILAAGLGTSGCFVETSSDSSRHYGTLVIDWTINGVRDPDQCDQGDVAALDVTIYHSGGTSEAYQASCRAFATSIELPRGLYTADAVLIDGAGFERTTVVDLQAFEILGGDELDIPIDFPASSFR